MLDPAEGHEVRVATLVVTVQSADGSSTSVWDNIALDPNHTNTFGAPIRFLLLRAESQQSLAGAHVPIVILAGGPVWTPAPNPQRMISYGTASNRNTGLAASLTTAIRATASAPSRYSSGGNDGQIPGADEYTGNVDPDTNDKFG